MNKILILILMIITISCNSNKQNHDSQDEPDSQDSHDLHDEPDYETQDNDVPDETPDEIPDDPDSTPGTAVNDDDFVDNCDVKLIDAKFPYYDKDGNITFCRPECDTPTEKDPQCMSNLWREQNHNLCHQYPEYDCCGYPCILESLKPMTKEEVDAAYNLANIPMHQCDLKIDPWSWGHDGTHGVVKSWNMSEGKVGFHLVPSALNILEWPVKRKAVTYDIATKKYSLIAPASNEMQAYYKGSRIIMSGDKRSLPIEQRKNYIVYMKDDGFVKVVYPGFIDNMPYEPAMNDKWVFANIREENQSSKMMYAKVGDPSSPDGMADSWKWTVLGEGYGWFPALSGNLLSVTDDNAVSYICDLSKNPKSVNDCLKMNGENEKLAYLYFDKENSGRLVYSQKLNGVFKIILAERNGDSYIKTELITDFTEATSKYAYSLVPRTLRGDLFLYEEIANVNGEGSGLLCYYRIDKKKKYCMKKMDKDEVAEDGTVIYPYGYAEFEGKWLLYQKRSSTPLILRDMECYCEEEGVCPFEE